MIVPMKKITVVVQEKDADVTLRALRKEGVLHIESQHVALMDDIRELREEYQSVSNAIECLPPSSFSSPPWGEDTVRGLIYEILNLANEKRIITEDLKKIEKDIEQWKEWENFDPELIDDLRDAGIWVRLCKGTKKDIKDIHRDIVLEEIFKKGNILHCIAISMEDITLPFENLSLPEISLQEMSDRKAKIHNRIDQIHTRFLEIAGSKDILSAHKKRLASLIEFNKVRIGMGKFGTLSYLIGYCPVYNVKPLEKAAEQERWGMIIEDPSENDNVPTLIKNPRWIEIVRPMFQMIKTVPGYREIDISLWFLLFFSVFFGMLIGDAGYGMVFFLINLVVHIKFHTRVKDKTVFFLIYGLSFCAIVWGVLSGTFFGQAYLSKRVEPLLPYLRDNTNVQALCFLIGALHLSIAHIWRFIRKIPSLKAFSEIGWILMIWTMYLLARYLILGDSFPIYGKWFLLGGTGLIILCTNPSKNIFKCIGSGTGDFLLHIVNSFTDVVSYIRLFAVGAATVAVADAFNQMAFSIGYGGNILKGFLIAIVLLSGHTLNILLGAMAVLVHGVRLNILEFSSHLDMQWSGIEYAPFKSK